MKHPSIVARTFGMGFFLAWVVGNAFTMSFGNTVHGDESIFVDKYCCIAFNLLVLAIITGGYKRIGSLVSRQWIIVLTTASAALAPLLIFVGLRTPELFAVFVFGEALRGIASALLFMTWSEVYSKLPIRYASICYSGAYFVSFLVHACMALLPGAMAIAFEIVCGFGAAVFIPLSISIEHPQPEEELVSTAPGSWTIPIRPILLTAAYTVSAFALRQIIATGILSYSWLGGGIVALLSLIGCAFFFERHFDASVLEFIALPLMVGGVLLWCLLGDSAGLAALFLADAGNVAFRIFILTILCNICFRYGVPALWLFGIVRLVMVLAEGCGLTVGLWASSLNQGTGSLEMDIFAYAMILILITVSTFTQRTRKLTETSWQITLKSDDHAGYADRLATVMGRHELLIWRCSQIARLYGLTQREEEILGHLVEGKKRSEIQEVLFISENTVRTHIRHIYEKLDVHSREEAAEVVEKA